MSPLLSPKIGIVSGIGPLAGADVLTKVFERAATVHGAVEDSQYPDVILLNHGIAGVDNSGDLGDNFETEILRAVEYLQLQGATVIGIACNTAHVYLSKIKAIDGCKLINLIDGVAFTAAVESGHYLLLTSSATKNQRLYHRYLEKYKVDFAETSYKQQKLLDLAIAAVMAHNLTQAGAIMEQVLDEALEDGFLAIIAGCTELPIALDHCKTKAKLRVLDSNRILAENLTNEYYRQIRT